MRILHVTDVYRPRIGGIELFVDDLTRAQRAAGHQVSVLTSTPGDPAARQGSVPVIRARGPVPGRAIAQALRSGEYDVVHGHLSVVSHFTTLVARSAVAAGVPSVLTVHSMWDGRLTGVRAVGAAVGWRRWPVEWTAVSQAAAVGVRRALDAETPVSVVPNAVDVDWWRAGLATPAAQGQGPVRLMSVMRLAGRKRPMALLKMLRAVRDVVPPDIELSATLVGDGPLAPRMRAELRRLHLDDWVQLPGQLSRAQIRELYADAHLYVSPAHRESFGIAALEARCAGLPVVAMRSGGVGEFISDGADGMLVENDKEMAAALAMLVTTPAVRMSFRAHATAIAPEFDWAHAIAKFSDAYGAAERRVPSHAHGRDRIGAPVE